MSINHTPIEEEILCINTNKVYDWVMLQSSVNRNILATSLGSLPVNPCGSSVRELNTECFITDANGNRLGPNSVIPIEETREREDRVFIIDGTEVILQNVSFNKEFYLVVEFSGLNNTTPFVERSAPIPIEIPESLFMCAPEGTELTARLTDFECSVRINCLNRILTSIDVSLTLCQSVQSTANVTIELAADFCEPRDVLTERCATPSIPPQCPVLFPG